MDAMEYATFRYDTVKVEIGVRLKLELKFAMSGKEPWLIYSVVDSVGRVAC